MEEGLDIPQDECNLIEFDLDYRLNVTQDDLLTDDGWGKWIQKVESSVMHFCFELLLQGSCEICSLAHLYYVLLLP